MLPPLFELDDYTRCIETGNVYCKLRANLQSSVNNSEVWKYIKGSIEDKTKYRRDVLFRNLCIPKHTAYHDEVIKKYSEPLVNKELEHLNLSCLVDVVDCTDGSISRSSFDYIVCMLVISYACLIAFATFQDFRTKNDKKDDGLLRKFSLRYNLRQRTKSTKNEDSEKLKSIQGIRFYTTIIVLLAHTKLKFTMFYVKNPSMVEEMMGAPWVDFLNTMDLFLVQIFFLVSSWLMTLQVYHIFRTHGEFSLKHALIIIINRYFRLVVTLTAVTLFLNISFSSVLKGPNNFNLLKMHLSSCERNWPATLLFLNNYYYAKDMCVVTSWYLSADFQMYIANTIILYAIFKYNLNMKKVFSSLLVIYVSLYGMIIYIYDMDIILRPFLRSVEYGGIFNSFPFILLYSSTFSISSSSCIGMILGVLYFKNNIQKNSIWAHFLIPSFMVLPLMAVFISTYEYKGFEAALLGPLVKPMFALGFGFGILGMSQNFGGIMKNIFEWKPAVLMSNFTYGIYLCQISICFINSEQSLAEAGFMKMIQEFFVNLIYCVPIGIILTLAVEEPGIMLQRKLLPQVKKYSEPSNGKTKSN